MIKQLLLASFVFGAVVAPVQEAKALSFLSAISTISLLSSYGFVVYNETKSAPLFRELEKANYLYRDSEGRICCTGISDLSQQNQVRLTEFNRLAKQSIIALCFSIVSVFGIVIPLAK